MSVEQKKRLSITLAGFSLSLLAGAFLLTAWGDVPPRYRLVLVMATVGAVPSSIAAGHIVAWVLRQFPRQGTHSDQQTDRVNARTASFAGLGLMVILLLASFGLRTHRLDAQSMGYDEIVSYLRAIHLLSPRAELGSNLWRARQFAYALLLRPVAMTTSSAFVLRWSSVLAGTLTVAVIYQVGCWLAGRRAGLLAAAFLMLSPMHLYYSHEVRQYALVLLTCLVSLWSLLLLEGRARWARWVYPLSAVLATALHFVAALWLVALNGFLMFRTKPWEGRGWSVWPVTQIGLHAVPAAILLLDPRVGLEWVGVIVGKPKPRHFEALFLEAVGIRADQRGLVEALSAGSNPMLGRWAPVIWGLLAEVLLFVLLGLGTWHLLRRKSATSARSFGGRWAVCLLALLTLGPPLALCVLSYIFRPVWVPRYLMPSVASFLLLLAVSGSTLRSRWLVGALAACVLTSSLGGIVRYHVDPDLQRHNWRDVVAYVVKYQRTGDGLLFAESFEPLVLQFYGSDEPIDGGALDLREGDEFAAERLRTALGEHGRVWVVWRKPPQEAHRWVGQAAPNAILLDYADFGKLKLYLYTSNSSQASIPDPFCLAVCAATRVILQPTNLQ
jgi:hypothetical protein